MCSFLDDRGTNPALRSCILVCLDVFPFINGPGQFVDVKISEEDAIVGVDKDVRRSNITMVPRVAMEICKGAREAVRPLD